MSDESRTYSSVALDDCLERISECLEHRRVIKANIQSYVNDEESWDSGLMPLLCEYYSINYRYMELMNDVILSAPYVNEETNKEEILLDERTYTMLHSYSKLMIVDELELKYKHRINLFVQ
jgi:hypothetical protein